MPAGDAVLAPGTYLARSDESSAFDYTVTFPAGWNVQGGNEFGRNADSAAIGFLPFLVDAIYADSCRGDSGAVTAVGPRPQDLVTALLAQPGPVKSTSVATTLGGYPATRIDLRVPKNLQTKPCNLGPGIVQLWVSEPDNYLVLFSDGVVSVYVVDVDGQRQVFTTQYLPGASQEDRAEIQQILDSIRIQK